MKIRILVILAFSIIIQNGFAETINSQNALEEIARQTGGVAFVGSKEDLASGKFLPASVEMLKQQKYALLWSARDVNALSTVAIPFSVDANIKLIWIMVYGRDSNPNVMLIGPGQQSVREQVISAGRKASIHIINAPSIGNWQLQLSGDADVSVQIKADMQTEAPIPQQQAQQQLQPQQNIISEHYSHIDVGNAQVVRWQMGHEGPNYFPYDGPLVPGTEENFTIGVSGPGNYADIRISMVDVKNGNILVTKPPIKYSGSPQDINFFVPFVIPENPFRLMITIKTAEGAIVTRTDDHIFDINAPKLEEFKDQIAGISKEECSMLTQLSNKSFLIDPVKKMAHLQLFCEINPNENKLSMILSLPIFNHQETKYDLVSQSDANITVEDCKTINSFLSRFPQEINNAYYQAKWSYLCGQNSQGFIEGRMKITVVPSSH